jgi:choice-of-anchor A domain-containing protein
LVCVDIPVIPTAICGNGIIETGEDCDGGACCTATCKFESAATTCRGAAGECDVAEKCSGTSSDCPTDVIKPSGTRCGEFFGMCDVRIERTCDGVSPKCFGPPAEPVLSSIISWEDFNVISFDSFYCHGGDVEGRLAARNSVDLQGFSLGLALTSAIDGTAPYSLFVAGDATWTDGSLWPDGSQVGDYYSEAYVGGTFTAPDYLLARRSGLFTTADANAKFDAAQAYYVQVQSQLTSLPTNANYEIKYTNGLFITCDASADLYHVKVADADYNKADWISLQGCKFSARWIVEITGTGNVVIKGQPFPGIVERVIYNIVGSGRTITGQTGIGGHILAPQNTYTQNSGVTYGKVVVGNFPESRQSNKPNCLNFRSVTISSIILKPVQIGDTRVYVADLSNFIAGDLVCIQGNCRKLVGGEIGDFDGDGVTDQVVSFEDGFPNPILAGTAMTTAVDANTGDKRATWGNNPTPGNSASMTGSSSTLAVCFALIFAFLAFF